MIFNGEFRVDATPEDVYAFLCDMGRFAPLLPTYLSHVPRGEGITDVTVAVGLGRLSGRATVRLRLTQVGRSAYYTGSGHTLGGRFGLHANFVVADDGSGGALVRWDGSMDVLGRLLPLVGGFIRPVAERHIDHLIAGVRSTLSRA